MKITVRYHLTPVKMAIGGAENCPFPSPFYNKFSAGTPVPKDINSREAPKFIKYMFSVTQEKMYKEDPKERPHARAQLALMKGWGVLRWDQSEPHAATGRDSARTVRSDSPVSPCSEVRTPPFSGSLEDTSHVRLL